MTAKKLYNGTLGTGSATLLTAATGKTTVITEMTVTNKTGTDATATITFDGTTILGTQTITKNTFYKMPLNSVLDAGDLVVGSAGTGSAIDVTICGYEV